MYKYTWAPAHSFPSQIYKEILPKDQIVSVEAYLLGFPNDIPLTKPNS